jgi:Zn-dependent metalloprotease
MHKHSGINCFIPPHILKNIATKGTESQKVLAIDTLKISAQMRGRRQALADFSAATFRVAAGGKDRIVYDAKNGSSLPGTIARKEGDAPVADVAVNEAYDGSGITYDLFNDVYKRNSIDASGMRLIQPYIIGQAMTTLSGTGSKWYMVTAMRTCLLTSGSSTASRSRWMSLAMS